MKNILLAFCFSALTAGQAFAMSFTQCPTIPGGIYSFALDPFVPNTQWKFIDPGQDSLPGYIFDKKYIWPYLSTPANSSLANYAVVNGMPRCTGATQDPAGLALSFTIKLTNSNNDWHCAHKKLHGTECTSNLFWH